MKNYRLKSWSDHPWISWVYTPFGMALLFVINLPGTLYGFWWYRHQLAASEPIFWPLIPDSPLASGDFTLLLVLLWLGLSFSWFECLAPAVLFKYGIWAVIINIHAAYLSGGASIENWMLALSHLGMALQALLFWPRMHYSRKTWIAVSLWILFNDFADYQWDIYPYLFDPRQYDLAWISALVLSVVVIGLGGYFASSSSFSGERQRINQLPKNGINITSPKIQSPK
ncbi:DUF1405 domain-containing protein [Heliobacterium mobile]|nr:DUF1405 domain-containing protein [Heliobacterium mobile]